MKKQVVRDGLASRLKSRRLNRDKLFLIMQKYGNIGIKALIDATPRETGDTAASWSFSLSKDLVLVFKNAEVTVYGVPIPKLIMYGYTRGHSHVPANDFVRRTLDPIIESLKNEIREEML